MKLTIQLLGCSGKNRKVRNHKDNGQNQLQLRLLIETSMTHQGITTYFQRRGAAVSNSSHHQNKNIFNNIMKLRNLLRPKPRWKIFSWAIHIATEAKKHQDMKKRIAQSM